MSARTDFAYNINQQTRTRDGGGEARSGYGMGPGRWVGQLRTDSAERSRPTHTRSPSAESRSGQSAGGDRSISARRSVLRYCASVSVTVGGVEMEEEVLCEGCWRTNVRAGSAWRRSAESGMAPPSFAAASAT